MLLLLLMLLLAMLLLAMLMLLMLLLMLLMLLLLMLLLLLLLMLLLLLLPRASNLRGWPRGAGVMAEALGQLPCMSHAGHLDGQACSQ